MDNANQKSSVLVKNEQELIVRTVARKGEEITIIERKQEPLRINGFDL